MRLLLTAGGVTNPTIQAALVDLLGKPIEESTALCIPTAMYGHPWLGPGVKAWEFAAGQEAGNPMVSLGWKSVGLLELTALPSIPDERWMPQVRDADVLLASGGDAIYLHHWLRESGMLDLFGELDDTVWVGMSAGSMVMTPRIGEEFVGWKKSDLGDRGLGLVEFAICPHLAVGDRPGNSMEAAEKWASKIDIPAFAMDDETAIVVDGDRVEVISEGVWHRLGDRD